MRNTAGPAPLPFVRKVEPEWLDGLPAGQGAASVRDIARINRLFGGHRVVRSLLRQVAPSGAFSVLDVGAASGDIARCIQQAHPQATVYSLDYRQEHLEGNPSHCLVADAFRLPLAPRSVDFVISSLFLHHFPDQQVVELLSGFRCVARQAVLAIDLQRHNFAAQVVPATRWLFRWHRVTVHDAAASVRSAFSRKELLLLAQAAGLQRAEVKVHAPWFRLSLIAPCE